MAITGSNFVRYTRNGLQVARTYWPGTGDRFEIRRQSLKLRFWDERHTHPTGLLIDLSYESIRALAGSGIYELRLPGTIGGQSNIRVIFFDPPNTWVLRPKESRPCRTVWVLEVMPKKRDDWAKNDITRFRNSRLLIVRRAYSSD